MSDTEINQGELYFLVARFLEKGACKETFEVLKRELNDSQLLPERVDWQGRTHITRYDEMVSQYQHIKSYTLLKICENLRRYVNADIPPIVPGVRSFLGDGRQSLIRTKRGLQETTWSSVKHSITKHGRSILPPRNIAQPLNFCKIHQAQLSIGKKSLTAFPTSCYDKIHLHTRKLGHLASVFCLIFDHTGKYIITAADDRIGKIWRLSDCRLLATLRGHSSEIADMNLSYDNCLLATAGCDKVVRVWRTKTCSPVAVLIGHTAMVNAVLFSPLVENDKMFLVSIANDGAVCFWVYDKKDETFSSKPIKFIERSNMGTKMVCASFSHGGMFLSTGSTDHVIRIYCFISSVPQKVCELEKHKGRVDSIAYSNEGTRFLSGSIDGTVNVWRYEKQQWKALLLDMACVTSSSCSDSSMDIQVTMVRWSINDSCVMTASSDWAVRVWDSIKGTLMHTLKEHTDNVYAIDLCPFDRRLAVTAGHDGWILLWDIERGVKIKSFYNPIEGQGYGAIYDCKFSRDGFTIAAVDSHGHLLVFGFGTSDNYNKLPDQLFFHTDYRPLMRDGNNYVLDEQTEQPPHLMPPPFLVNSEGNPHRPEVQKYVPGREHLTHEQLIPQMGVDEDGEPEVIGDRSQDDINQHEESASGGDLDFLIEHLQRAQDERIAAEVGTTSRSLRSQERTNIIEANNTPLTQQSRNSSLTDYPNSSTYGTERSNYIRSPEVAGRFVIPELPLEKIRQIEETNKMYARLEWDHFVSEGKKKSPTCKDTGLESDCYMLTREHRKKQKRKTDEDGEGSQQSVLNRLTTRALYDSDIEPAENDQSEDTSQCKSPVESKHGSETEDYSDWTKDHGENLEPPRRSRRKVFKKQYPGESSDEAQQSDSDKEVVKYHMTRSRRQKRSRPKKKHEVKKEPGPSNSDGTCSLGPVSVTKPGPSTESSVEQPLDMEEIFRPPEWLTDVLPRKAPYIPQMGDEVIYFRQGHSLYVEAVKKRNVYNISMSSQPWITYPDMQAQEFGKVVYIKVEIGPPRLCCLKIAFSGKHRSSLKDLTINCRYHDMPDVIDFLVLQQNYQTAIDRNWKPGDRFRSMIDDAWWRGTVVSSSPLHPTFPNSLFQSFNIHWDNGEKERLSPWDMEPIVDEGVADGVSVTKDELTLLMYMPIASEWPGSDRDTECERISRCVSLIMEHSVSEEFLIPVDINAFPLYYQTIEYPMDLTMIKNRLDNRFYRRITSIQFDVRYLEKNAKTFNKPGSVIVRRSHIIVETLLHVIKDPYCYDPLPIINRLCKNKSYRSRPTSEFGSGFGKHRSSSSHQREVLRFPRTNQTVPTSDVWMKQSDRLLSALWTHSDSEPFRHPVDSSVYQDYYSIVKYPMDLGTMRQKLDEGRYNNPIDVHRDLQLMFSNARTYTPHTGSRIYRLTLSLSSKFESQMQSIINQWTNESHRPKRSVRPSNPFRSGSYDMSHSSSVSHSRRPRRTMYNRYSKRQRIMQHDSSSDNPEEEEEHQDDSLHNVPRRGSSNGIPRLTSNSNVDSVPEYREHGDDANTLYIKQVPVKLDIKNMDVKINKRSRIYNSRAKLKAENKSGSSSESTDVEVDYNDLHGITDSQSARALADPRRDRNGQLWNVTGWKDMQSGSHQNVDESIYRPEGSLIKTNYTNVKVKSYSDSLTDIPEIRKRQRNKVSQRDRHLVKSSRGTAVSRNTRTKGKQIVKYTNLLSNTENSSSNSDTGNPQAKRFKRITGSYRMSSTSSDYNQDHTDLTHKQLNGK